MSAIIFKVKRRLSAKLVLMVLLTAIAAVSGGAVALEPADVSGITGPLNNFIATLQGPIARVGILLMLVIAGFVIWIGDGRGVQMVGRIILGAAVILGAASFAGLFFPS